MNFIYTNTAWIEKLGKEKDVNVSGDNIDGMGKDDPFDFCLRYNFYQVTDKYGTYYQLMNDAGTTGNFAYQYSGDDEPCFARSEHEARESLKYLGYNFQWDLSFTSDGHAVLGNEEYGHIYYSETPSSMGTNFRLSKTAASNLIAYKIVEEYQDTYTSSLAYNIVHVESSEDGYIRPMDDGKEGGGTCTMLWEDEEGNPLDNPVYAIMKGYSCMFVGEYERNLYKGELTCSDPEAGKIGTQTFRDEEFEGLIVTPTQECTVSLKLTYDPVKLTIGDKEVAYGEEESDINNDGSILFQYNEIMMNDATLNGDVVSPLDRTWLNVTGNNSINGNIVSDGLAGFYGQNGDDNQVNITGSITCTGTANGMPVQDMVFCVYHTSLTIMPSTPSASPRKKVNALVPAISGFSDLQYDNTEYVIAQPVNGYYDTAKKMLVDAEGNPSPILSIVPLSTVTGINNVTKTYSPVNKFIKNNRIVIRKNGRLHNTLGIEVK